MGTGVRSRGRSRPPSGDHPGRGADRVAIRVALAHADRHGLGHADPERQRNAGTHYRFSADLIPDGYGDRNAGGDTDRGTHDRDAITPAKSDAAPYGDGNAHARAIGLVALL